MSNKISLGNYNIKGMKIEGWQAKVCKQFGVAVTTSYSGAENAKNVQLIRINVLKKDILEEKYWFLLSTQQGQIRSSLIENKLQKSHFGDSPIEESM